MSSILAQIAPCSSLLVILGVGDGTVIRACCDDRRIREKDIWVVAYPGEVLPDGPWPERLQIAKIASWEQMEAWIRNAFADHNDIVRLGGCDFLEPPLDPEIEALRESWHDRVTALLSDRCWALGNDINDSFMGLWHAAQNAAIILPAPSIGQLAGSFGMVPAISVGAGPSVGAHLDELRRLQDRCLIVACDSVCPGLIKEGIVPHFVTPLERLRQQTQFVECLRGTRAIFAGIPACHPTTVEPFGDRVLYLHALDKLYDWLEPSEGLRCFTGSSTGVLSFYIAASLTRGPVYLLGHDLAREGTASHWTGAEVAGSAFAQEERNAGGCGTNGYERRMIPGNGGGMLESIMWWDHFRGEIASQAALAGGRVYNVNAHEKKYAVIEHTLPAPLPDPDSLPILPEIVLPRTNTARLASWRERAGKMTDDSAAFLRGMADLRASLERLRHRPPSEWNVEALMASVTPEQHVSAGNIAAFQYFLRSAIYNEQTYACYRARSFASRESACWTTMRSLDGLADGMTTAMHHLMPVIQKITAISSDT